MCYIAVLINSFIHSPLYYAYILYYIYNILVYKPGAFGLIIGFTILGLLFLCLLDLL